MKQTMEKHVTLTQFLKFGIVGVSNTVVNYMIYLISLDGLQVLRGAQKFDYLIAQMIAFLLSVLWSFFWNYRYVFASEETGMKAVAGQLLRAYASYSVTGIFLNSALLMIEIDLLGMSKVIAPLTNLFISVPVNFLLNKHWTFARK